MSPPTIFVQSCLQGCGLKIRPRESYLRRDMSQPFRLHSSGRLGDLNKNKFFPLKVCAVSSRVEDALNDFIPMSPSPHPNVWGCDYIQSIKSSSTDPRYIERAETLISEIKSMLSAIGDGELMTPSAYDTAWVARIPAIDGPDQPQFPETVEWILKCQLKDGSWGTEDHFLLSERLLATLSCVLALCQWNVGDLQVQQGIEFIKSNIESLKAESDQDTLVTDFQLIFPSLLKEAQSLTLPLPYDLPFVNLMRTRWQDTLTKEEIPHGPSSLKYPLESMQDILDWKKIMELRSQDGSFLGSPASTACVFLHTGDMRCLEYLKTVLAKFGSFVPCMYPVDIIERLLVVDNIERLGIDRHFQKEINEFLDFVYSHWNERGIGYNSFNSVADLEITAMAFRLLRLHLYNVTPVAFKNFKEDNGHFLGSEGQFNKQVGSMLNLYKASEVAFPGENILDEAKGYATKYLREALTRNETFSAWNCKQNLSREIEYTLETSWYTSLPRVETRRYCEVYRPDYVRLAKGIYRLPFVDNEKLLELAKLDFNIIQCIHQEEMKNIMSWFRVSGLRQFTFAKERPMEYYLIISAGMYEPQYAKCRVTFTKLACLQTVLDDMYDTYGTFEDLRLFTEAVRRWDLAFAENLPDYMNACYKIYYNMIHEVAWELEKEQGGEWLTYFRNLQEEYLLSYLQESEWQAAKHVPSFDEYIKNGIISSGMRPVLLTVVLLMGQPLPREVLEQIDYPGSKNAFIELTSYFIRLIDDIMTYKSEKGRGELASSIECYMREHLPECTEEEALNHIECLMDAALKELTREFLKPDNSCNRVLVFSCKKMIFEVVKGVLAMYKYGDTFSSPNVQETMDYVKESFIHPLPLGSKLNVIDVGVQQRDTHR